MNSLSQYKRQAIAVAVLSLFAQHGWATITTSQNVTENITVEADQKVQNGVTEYDNRYAGIIADDGKLEISVAEGALLTVDGDLAAGGDDRLFGVYAGRGDSLVLNGDLTIDLNSAEGAQLFRIYGDVDVNGTVTAVAQAGSSTSVTAVGVDVRPDGDNVKTVTFRGDVTSIKAKSQGARVLGVQNFNTNGSTVNFNAERTEIYAENNASANSLTQGVLNYQATTNFNGNTLISVKGGVKDTYGVDVQCDPGNSNDTVVNFTGDETDIVVSATGAVYAVRPSGVPGSINFSGKEINISATSTDSYAFGVYAQYGGEMNVTNPDATVTIDVKAKQDAYGIYNSTYGGSNTFQFGSVNIEAPLTITVESSTRAVGVSNSVYVGDTVHVVNEDDGLFLKGGATITVTADGADAVAVGVEAANTQNGALAPTAQTVIENLTLSVEGINGATAAGITGSDNALITISGNSKVVATGESASGLVLSDSSLTTAGSLDVSGATVGISLDENSTVTVEQNSILSTNSMQSTGKTVLTNHSTLSVTGAVGATSVLGSVSADNSSVNVGAGKYEISEFVGEEKSICFTNLAQNEGVHVSGITGAINAVATGVSNDQYANAREAAEALANALNLDGASAGNTVEIEQGAVNNGLVAELNENNELVNLRETENTTMASFGSVALLGAFQWRHDMNDLTKRMGELRDSPQGVGTWARLYGSDQEYNGTESKNTSVQIGADCDVGAGWKAGAAFTYTNGTSDFSNGEADHEAFGFALYGTWLADNGQFVDLIAKYSRLDTDFSIDAMNGSYDNNAWSISAEYGWHLKFSDLAFVEPQVEVTYGTVFGDDVRASNGVKLEQDDFTSLIGRIGIRGGFYFPEKKGNLYARFSVLHDFDGEMETEASHGRAHNVVKDDLGGTWVEYGVGANFRLSDVTYTYVDLERNSGGEVKENWRWNVGLRHVF